MYITPLDADEIGMPVAVITGGWSRERDRALLSGKTVTAALTDMGVTAHAIGLADPREVLLNGLGDAATAFLAIAGRGAEDGRLQGLLETLSVPSTGSGVLASAIGMNKLHAKTLVSAAGVCVPRGTRIDPTAAADDEAVRVSQLLGGLPVMIKPVSECGSIGVQVATTVQSLSLALEQLDVADGEMMAEVFLPGALGERRCPGGRGRCRAGPACAGGPDSERRLLLRREARYGRVRLPLSGLGQPHHARRPGAPGGDRSPQSGLPLVLAPRLRRRRRQPLVAGGQHAAGPVEGRESGPYGDRRQDLLRAAADPHPARGGH